MVAASLEFRARTETMAPVSSIPWDVSSTRRTGSLIRRNILLETFTGASGIVTVYIGDWPKLKHFVNMAAMSAVGSAKASSLQNCRLTRLKSKGPTHPESTSSADRRRIKYAAVQRSVLTIVPTASLSSETTVLGSVRSVILSNHAIHSGCQRPASRGALLGGRGREATYGASRAIAVASSASCCRSVRDSESVAESAVAAICSEPKGRAHQLDGVSVPCRKSQ